ncbi:TadE family type IV pilus minor pilin [Sphaerisporangium flaviroseum]|uniref:TadE family type IV pilus minor pilin n=1 Tax=Sphaerisporangium flaviroseum TaxID=509199 RepID=UPI0031E6E236
MEFWRLCPRAPWAGRPLRAPWKRIRPWRGVRERLRSLHGAWERVRPWRGAWERVRRGHGAWERLRSGHGAWKRVRSWRRAWARSDTGSVTAEIAVGLPSLTLVLGAALWGVAAVSAQLQCVDAARSGARAAARGELLEAVREAASRAAPIGSAVSVARDSKLSRVTVSASIRPDWMIAVPAVAVSASAISATEPGADSSSLKETTDLLLDDQNSRRTSDRG